MIHQRIAFQLLFATRFDDAGKHFLLGDADPRLLIRLFPDLRGSMINPGEQIAVYAGISESVEAFDNLDAIGKQYTLSEAVWLFALRSGDTSPAKAMLLAHTLLVASQLTLADRQLCAT